MARKSKQETETAMVKHEGGEIALPKYLEEDGGAAGTEALTSDDVLIPRLKLVQGLSGEHTQDGIKEGHFANSITKEDYGDELTFTPLIVVPGYLMFEGKGRDAKLIARKFTGDIIPPLNEKLLTDDVKAWKTDKKTGEAIKPDAAKCYVYIGFVNGEDLVSWTLSNTAVKVAKQFNSMLKRKSIPAFAYKIKVSSKMDSSESGDYYAPTVTLDGYVDEKTFHRYKLAYERFSTKQIQVKFEDETAMETGSAQREKDKHGRELF